MTPQLSHTCSTIGQQVKQRKMATTIDMQGNSCYVLCILMKLLVADVDYAHLTKLSHFIHVHPLSYTLDVHPLKMKGTHASIKELTNSKYLKGAVFKNREMFTEQQNFL